MLNYFPQLNLANATRYFREHLKVGDYYSEDRSIAGLWFGKGAEKLGLSGEVKEADFLAMCQGNDPNTGKFLTLRRNQTNSDGKPTEATRRVFYDFVFAPPKSVSVMALLQDERIIELHNAAVAKALVELEKFAATRVRRDGASSDRITGNVVTARFRHDTSREQDPQLHTHCVTFNATHDDSENRWKALQTYEILKAQRMISAAYDLEMAGGLTKLGYELVREGQSYEIKGVSKEIIGQFSKRQRQIDDEIARLVATGQTGDVPVEVLRKRIAHEIRRRKIRDGDPDELRAKWRAEIGAAGLRQLTEAKNARPLRVATDLDSSVQWAMEFVFERKSVARFHELEAAVARRMLGASVEMKDVRAALLRAGVIADAESDRVTSREALDREFRIVTRARNGRASIPAINEAFDASKTQLDAEQQQAVDRLLKSTDRIALFRGAAGTGKSFALRELAHGVQQAGKPLIVLAPQSAQVRDLDADGIGKSVRETWHSSGCAPQSIARFLQSGQLPKNAVVLVDEAGQVGGRTMDELLTRVLEANGRVILSGDTRQYGAVEASDALRAIELHAGLRAAEISTVRRQNPDLAESPGERSAIIHYRDAVIAASEGDATKSLDILIRNDAVHQVSESSRVQHVADELSRELLAGKRALAVSQTRVEVAAINAAVTEKMIGAGVVTAPVELTAFSSRDLLTAEKAEKESYRIGDYVRFVRNYGANRRGDIRQVVAVDAKGIVLEPKEEFGRGAHLSYKARAAFDVMEEKILTVGIGSRLQIKANAVTEDGAKLINGEIVVVRSIDKKGNVTVEDERGLHKKIAAAARIFQHGYAVTAYASQGKTVDVVIVSDSGSIGATSAKQWYVSISRARRAARIVTSSIEDLSARIQRLGNRDLALDLRPHRARPAAKKNFGRHVRVHLQLAKRKLQRRVSNSWKRLKSQHLAAH